jgi:hypothetical protein
VLEPDPLEDLERPPPLLHVGHAEDAQREHHVLEHRLALDELEILEDEPDRPAIALDVARRQRRQIAPVDERTPGRRFLPQQDAAASSFRRRSPRSGRRTRPADTQRDVVEREHVRA